MPSCQKVPKVLLSRSNPGAKGQQAHLLCQVFLKVASLEKALGEVDYFFSYCRRCLAYRKAGHQCYMAVVKPKKKKERKQRAGNNVDQNDQGDQNPFIQEEAEEEHDISNNDGDQQAADQEAFDEVKGYIFFDFEVNSLYSRCT